MGFQPKSFHTNVLLLGSSDNGGSHFVKYLINIYLIHSGITQWGGAGLIITQTCRVQTPVMMCSYELHAHINPTSNKNNKPR